MKKDFWTIVFAVIVAQLILGTSAYFISKKLKKPVAGAVQ